MNRCVADIGLTLINTGSSPVGNMISVFFKAIGNWMSLIYVTGKAID